MRGVPLKSVEGLYIAVIAAAFVLKCESFYRPYPSRVSCDCNEYGIPQVFQVCSSPVPIYNLVAPRLQCVLRVFLLICPLLIVVGFRRSLHCVPTFSISPAQVQYRSVCIIFSLLFVFFSAYTFGVVHKLCYA